MAKYIGYGTKLYFAEGENWTLVANVSDINGPGMKRDTVDTTNHSSPSGYKEFLAGLIDGGEITFSIFLDPADASHNQTAGLLKVFAETQPRNWRLVTPVGTGTANQFYAYTFSALVTGYEMKFPVEEGITADITLKIAGAVTQATITLT
jgi:predicted secreted protein